MICWIKSRRVSILTAAVLVDAALLALVGDARIPTAGIFRSAGAPIAGVVIFPLIVSCALQYSREGLDWRIERTAVRHITAFDAALCLAVATALVAIGLLSWIAGGAMAIEGARNGLGYLGIGLMVSRFAGPRVGAAAPAFYVFVMALFASAVSAPRDLLTWPLHHQGSFKAAACALILFATGLIVTTVTPRTAGDDLA